MTTDIVKHFLHHNRQNPRMYVKSQNAENLVHTTPLRSTEARTLVLLGKGGGDLNRESMSATDMEPTSEEFKAERRVGSPSLNPGPAAI